MTESPVNWIPLVSSEFLNSLYFIFKTRLLIPTCLASKSQKSSCLCFVGLKDMGHHIQLSFKSLACTNYVISGVQCGMPMFLPKEIQKISHYVYMCGSEHLNAGLPRPEVGSWSPALESHTSGCEPPRMLAQVLCKSSVCS